MTTDGPSADALAGLRVIDLSRNVAGPFAAMLLGDLGADVVKVERPPKGDEARRHGPPFLAGESPYFLSLNRNKRSLLLDLKDEAGVAVARRLLAGADVAISNYRPGVLERLGLAPESLRHENPRLILARVTGFGPNGPWAGKPAYDHIIQGMSGLMSVTGSEDCGPFRVGVSISDVVTGLFAAYGVLAALHERERSGRGQVVDVSLLGATIAGLTFQAAQYLAGGERPRRRGNDHPMIAPYGTFPTADGNLSLPAGTDAMFGRLCRELGLPEDDRFQDNPGRVRHRAELHEAICLRLRQRTTDEWSERLTEAGVACGPVLHVDEALTHPATTALGMVQEVDHPAAGRIRMLGFPVQLSATPASTRQAPPLLGQHTAEVLAELGYSRDEIEAMEKQGALG